jgi:Tfp pilus assembly protein PilF
MLLLAIATGAGCRAVTPRPSTADASQLPRVEPDASEQRSRDELIAAAIEALRLDRLIEAAAAARSALAIDPRAARAHAIEAVSSQRSAQRDSLPALGPVRRAEFTMQLALQLAPIDPFVGWLHAVFLADGGHVSAAAAAAEAALGQTTATGPERAALLGAAAAYRYELGEERRALPHLEQYLALRPGDGASRYRLAVCLLRMAEQPQGDTPAMLLEAQRAAERAANAFQRCAEAEPTDLEAALAVATAWSRAAALAAQRPAQGSPSSSETTAAFLQRAVVQLTEVAARFPNAAEPWFRLGVVHEQAGDAGAAMQAYQQATAGAEPHVGAMVNLAKLAERAGDPARAEILLRRTLAVKDGPEALRDDERDRIAKWLDARLRAAR